MNWYKSKALGLIALMATLTAVGGGAPFSFGYRSLGVDTYASGEPVRDGECYALVWMANNNEFAGFNRDGSLVDAEKNAVVHVRSLAENGRCPPVNFIVDDDFRISHANGEYRVVVLDTRCASGAPAELAEGNELRRVNGWGWAKVAQVATKNLGFGANQGGTAVSGGCAGTAAKMPVNCRKPVITSFSFDKDGNAVVECASTEQYLTYRLAMGDTPDQVGEATGADSKDGSGNAEPVRFVIRKSELNGAASGFVRVKAATEL